MLLMAVLLPAESTFADEYTDTIKIFKNAGQSGSFFSNSYGYAVFPTIGKGGLGIGAQDLLIGDAEPLVRRVLPTDPTLGSFQT